MVLHPEETTNRTPAVVAIVVTFRRHELLAQTLDSIVHQTAPTPAIVVVDNEVSSELAEQVGRLHPDAEYVSSGDNLGPGGGFGVGLRHAQDKHPKAQWYWLLDDDSPPALNALELALDAASAATSYGAVGAIGLRGGHVKHGRIRHDLPAGSVNALTPADFLLVDGSILSAEAVRRVGYPRADFFIMMEDLEYSLRVGESGLALLVRPDDGSTNLYQGSGAPWRGYYQSRNHLRLALERRSPAWLIGWLIREAAINAHHLRHARWAAIRYRIRGAVDAVRKRMGRVVEPVSNQSTSTA